MTSERWEQVRGLFHQVVDMEPGEREQSLRDHPGEESVKQEVRRLLRTDDSLTDFLDPSPVGSSRIPNGTRLLDRFEISSFLGSGGMGEVYAARDLRLEGQEVAVKTLRGDLSGDPRLRSRFTKEILMARSVSHPNLCPIYDLFEADLDGRPLRFLTMRKFEGETLRDRIDREGAISPALRLGIVEQVCAGLDAAHAAGIIHGDLKSSNVMLVQGTTQASAVLMDFGLARTLEEGENAGASTAVFGTPGYMAPEVLQRAPLSPASDLYSLGVLMHEMCTGKLPASDSPVPLEPNWKRVVDQCLEHKPEKRPSSARAVVETLRGTPSEKTRARAALATAMLILLGLAATPAVRRAVAHAMSPVPTMRHLAFLPVEVGPAEGLADIGEGVLENVAARLVRAEPVDKDFWLVSPADQRAQKAFTLETLRQAFPINLALRSKLFRDSRNYRLTVEALDAKNAHPLGSREIMVPVDELFRLSELGTTEIAEMLKVDPLPGAPAAAGTTNAEAYRAYEAGRAALAGRDLEGTDKGLTQLGLATELDPQFALAYAALADAYTRKFTLTSDPAMIELAANNARRASDLAPGVAEVHRGNAEVLMARGNHEAALSELKRATELDPQEPTNYALLGQEYRALGKLTEAEQSYKRAIAIRPNYGNAYNHLGSFYNGLGRYAEAAAAFQRMTETLPTQTLGYNNLGGAYVMAGDCAKAIPVFQRSLEIKPSTGAYTNLGTCEFKSGDYVKALAAMKAAVALSPKEHVAWRNLGDVYQRLPGHGADATDAYQKAAAAAQVLVDANPHNATALSGLTVYLAKLGRNREAAAAIARVDALHSNDRSVLFRTAVAAELIGQRKEALARVKQALSNGYSRSDVLEARELSALVASREFHNLQ